MSKPTNIPKATITRLSLYCRQLELLEFDGYRMVSSEKLASLCQVNPAQVRKDLGYFGEFGILYITHRFTLQLALQWFPAEFR